MEAIISAVTGAKDRGLKDLNKTYRNFYGKQKKKIEKLSAHREIMTGVIQRINSTSMLLRTPATPEAALERLRNARTFEQEILDFEAVLKSSRIARSQSDRAKAPRIKIGPDRMPLRAVISKLTAGLDRSLQPSELWPHFYAKLDQLECEPELLGIGNSISGQSIKFFYYKLGSSEQSERTLSFTQFRRIVAALRIEKR